MPNGHDMTRDELTAWAAKHEHVRYADWLYQVQAERPLSPTIMDER